MNFRPVRMQAIAVVPLPMYGVDILPETITIEA